MCRGKRVLELGAAAALPSFIAAVNGASLVVITDFPEPILVKNIEYNIAHNLPPELASVVVVEGFIWGHDPTHLLALNSKSAPDSYGGLYDLIILADLIFNHTEHDHLLTSCLACLAPGGTAFVTFTHHVPKKAHMDMAFFERARERGFDVTKVFEVKAQPMFPNDEGDVEMRSTVHGYFLTHKSSRR
ncbi:nicotinamide n-methyltransferase [Gonapodya sp. JEL0774]|nr:nicotinamide n-methyltransferase [Gonapodya sp. JEL0774]